MLVNELRLPRYNAELLYGNLRPYGHQIIVNDAINNYSEFCLFDPSPTGSGKTAAWAIPALNGRLGVVIAAYPTNALAQDQYRSILKTKKDLYSNIRIEFITAETLHIKKSVTKHFNSGDILENTIRDMSRSGGGIIITNPDILDYALKGYYYNPYLQSVFHTLVDTIVFDEFHLYDLRQSDIILFLLHHTYLLGTTGMNRVIFLSATPDREIIDKVRNVIGCGSGL